MKMTSLEDKFLTQLSNSQSQSVLERRETDDGYSSNINSPEHNLASLENTVGLGFSTSDVLLFDLDMDFDNSNEFFTDLNKSGFVDFKKSNQNTESKSNELFKGKVCINSKRKRLPSENSNISHLYSESSKLFTTHENACYLGGRWSKGLAQKICIDMTRDEYEGCMPNSGDLLCLQASSAKHSHSPCPCKHCQVNGLTEARTGTSYNGNLSQSIDFERQYSDGALYSCSRNAPNTNHNISKSSRKSEYSRSLKNQHIDQFYITDEERASPPGDMKQERTKSGSMTSLIGFVDARKIIDERNLSETDKPVRQQEEPIQCYSPTLQNVFSTHSQRTLSEINIPKLVPDNCLDEIEPSFNSVSENGLENSSIVGPNQAVADDVRYTTEDEVWKSYLENPLTAATSAMMSMHGDEDSAAALGILYEYYKVPAEKRILSYQHEQRVTPERYQADRNTEVGVDENVPVESTYANAVSVPSSKRHFDTVISEGSALQDGDVTCKTTAGRRDARLLNTFNSTLSHSSEHSVSAYLTIGRNAIEDAKGIPLTPDSEFSESKESPTHQLSQTFSCGEYSGRFSSLSRYQQRKQRLSVPSLQSPMSGETCSSLHHVAPLTSPAHSFSVFSSSREDLNTIDYYGDLFEYTMEAPKSLKQKEGEPTMSYINKGQFYCISFRACTGSLPKLSNNRVTSVVQMVFGDSKSRSEQLSHWEYWHGRQHTSRQRIIDIADSKESSMIGDVDEFAHNAIAFSWDTQDIAKIFVNCNCLSTDFSAQKGVKGLPLLLQIDTYLNNKTSGMSDHRGVCQLKVFCDKGAERKIRDEERKASRKRQKNGHKGGLSAQQTLPISPVEIKPIIDPLTETPPFTTNTSAGNGVPIPKRHDTVYFMTVSDRTTPPVYFIPEILGNISSIRNHVISHPGNTLPPDVDFTKGVLSSSSSAETEQVFLKSQFDCLDNQQGTTKRRHSAVALEEEVPEAKIPRTRVASDAVRKVLLYIRKETDDVYDGVMLKEPTLRGLKEALQEKYEISLEKISKVLKKSKKGVTVNVDDNIVRHYSNEDTFVIDIRAEERDKDVSYVVILSAV